MTKSEETPFTVLDFTFYIIFFPRNIFQNEVIFRVMLNAFQYYYTKQAMPCKVLQFVELPTYERTQSEELGKDYKGSVHLEGFTAVGLSSKQTVAPNDNDDDEGFKTNPVVFDTTSIHL